MYDEFEDIDLNDWYRNFKKSVSDTVKEQQRNGVKVMYVLVTILIYEKVKKAVGYDPDNINGYLIKVMDPNEYEYDEDEEFIMVESKTIN